MLDGRRPGHTVRLVRHGVRKLLDAVKAVDERTPAISGRMFRSALPGALDRRHRRIDRRRALCLGSLFPCSFRGEDDGAVQGRIRSSSCGPLGSAVPRAPHQAEKGVHFRGLAEGRGLRG